MKFEDPTLKKINHAAANKAFSKAFWAHFGENHWEKKEFVVNDGSITPPVTEEEFFNIIVDMSERQINAYKNSGELIYDIRLYVGENREPIDSDKFHLYPKREDKSFQVYSKRVELDLDGKEFSIIIDGVDMSRELKAWTHDFLSGMSGPLKAVSYGHMWSIFFGNYSTTVYGVHDHVSDTWSESAFYFPISGNKQMRTWRPEYVAQHHDLAEARDFSMHLEDSILLACDPGGMMYWPSDRWHVGSSSGGDVSIVLGVRAFTGSRYQFSKALFELKLFDRYFRGPLASRFGLPLAAFYFRMYLQLLRFSKRARSNQIGALPFTPDNLQKSATIIPAEVRNSARPYAYLFGKNFERVLSLYWLFNLSTMGMEVTAPKNTLRTTFLGQDSKIVRNVGVIMLWRKIDSNALMVVSEIHSFEAPIWFLPVVTHIASTQAGEELSYSDLMRLKGDIERVKFEHTLVKFFKFLIGTSLFEELS